MANDGHVALLKQGVTAWNAWRETACHIRPDLSQANLSTMDLRRVNFFRASLRGTNFRESCLIKANLRGAYLGEANLRGADLSGVELNEADLSKAYLRGTNLSGANLTKTYIINADLTEANLTKANLHQARLREAYLIKTNLSRANLSSADFDRANLSEADLRAANLRGSILRGADLHQANLSGANLNGADLWGANLSRANLSRANLNEALLYNATLVDTDLTGADISRCCVYGVSAWNLKLKNAQQLNLVITPWGEPEITVDNIEVAQFIYLMLSNQKIRDVIETITSKAVLILGRFTDERKTVLDALRDELRKRDYLPILFDCEKPRSRDTDETITLLARMAKFVIADLSDAKAVLQELRAIVPDLPSLPVQPIILATEEEPGMFDFYRNRPSFLAVHRYSHQEQLIADLSDKVIRPAELKVLDLRG